MLKKILICLREKLFWFIDRLSGQMVYKAFQEMVHINNLDSFSQELLNHQDTALQKLLKFAVTTTGFYTDYYQIRLRLSDFPVIDKSMIRNKREHFISKSIKKDELYKMATSGSTGTPFTCYQNKDKRKRVNAEVIYYNNEVNYNIGQRIIFLRSLVDQSNKSRLEQWLQNIYQIDVNKLDDRQIEKLLLIIKKISGEGSMLQAYGSTFDTLGDFFKRKGTANKCNIFGLVSISEMFFDHTRAITAEAFKCKCVSRYSNQENGILGQDGLENNVFVLNETNYIFEILEFDSDSPVSIGDIGRIVITDLYNYAMPLIRYDTGDVGALTIIEVDGLRKRAIKNFSGRRIDMIFDPDGKFTSPHKISVAFWQYPELKQFQFIQKDRNEYLVRLNTDGKFEKLEHLKKSLIAILGGKALLKFEFVDEIPVLASGKRKYIQNDYIKS